MFEKISEIWPALISIAGAIGGLAYFLAQVFTIRKQKLEIEAMKRKKEAEGGIIYKPSGDEILKYGVSRKFQLLQSGATIICFVALTGYFYSLSSTVDLPSVSEKTVYSNKNLENKLLTSPSPVKTLSQANAKMVVSKVRDTVYITALIRDTVKENQMLTDINTLKNENSKLRETLKEKIEIMKTKLHAAPSQLDPKGINLK